MALLSNFNTRTKLMLSFGVIFLVILTIIVQSYFSVTGIRNSGEKLAQTLYLSKDLTQLHSDENRIRSLVLELMILKDEKHSAETREELLQQVKLDDNRIKAIKVSMMAFPAELKIFQDITDEIATYRKNRELELEMIASRKQDEAIDFDNRIQEPLYAKIMDDFLLIELNLDKEVSSIGTNNSNVASSIIIKILIGGGILILISLLLGLWIRGMLTRIFKEINEGVNILGTSAAEILTTVTEVSTGATETATSVSETTVTIEEIRQTALVAAQKAQEVLESSHRASEAAENGKEAVQQTVEGMNRINDQMRLISESVNKLSDQSRTIGEITTTVNDIADQSNLLAVNAAIESARAGEQGRGFGVVAQEIRMLAEQSKKATAQVREILNDIQKGMNLTVIATEHGSKAVESGNRLALRSGEIIEILADTVNDAVKSVIQISASSQQQMAGMDQIVPAMENIKQASEQNVIGTRQTQTAAHNLNQLGHNLKDVMEKYKF